jgi:hypothetical protein
VQTMNTYSHLLVDVDGDEVGGLDEAFGSSGLLIEWSMLEHRS